MKQFKINIVLLTLFISCSKTAVDPHLKVSVTTENYAAIYYTWAMINIKNETSRDVYFTNKSDRIGFWKLEKSIYDSWIDVSTDTSFCRWLPTSTIVKLQPGETYHDSVLVLRAGKYRMEFPFSWDENETETDEISPEEFIVE